MHKNPDPKTEDLQRPFELTPHDWEEYSRTAKKCRVCTAVAVRRDAGDGARWVYARRGEGFRRTAPACEPYGRSLRTPEETVAKIREELWRRFQEAGPGARARAERHARLPQGYYRQSALSGQLDVLALLSALTSLGLDPDEFFRKALGREQEGEE